MYTHIRVRTDDKALFKQLTEKYGLSMMEGFRKVVHIPPKEFQDLIEKDYKDSGKV